MGPRRPGVRVWIPAFLESTVGPRHIRDISGSRNPLEGVLGVPAEIATSVGPGGSFVTKWPYTRESSVGVKIYDLRDRLFRHEADAIRRRGDQE